jgi:rfaE bifunctional protein nucleotidyltransferase chain/domain
MESLLDRIVLTTGTFNIIHAGHIELFNFCKSFGNLYIGINSDKYLISKYKGKYVPIEYRIKVLSELDCIESIYIFDEFEPTNLIKKIRPDFYVKGPDYFNKEIPELNILQQLNIKYLISNSCKILSTSNII